MEKATSEQNGEGEILTGVERVVMGTNGTILLKSPNKSHITSHITDSTLWNALFHPHCIGKEPLAQLIIHHYISSKMKQETRLKAIGGSTNE